MAKIKICGLQRIEDVLYINEFKPDFVGFILSSGFRRSISANKAKALRKTIDSDIKVVGVFVDDDVNYIKKCVSENIIDMVQLHGNESPQYCDRLLDIEIIKAFKCDENTKNIIKNYHTSYFLFDSGTGTGKTFDWTFVPKTDVPYFLAGGLDSNNISTALKMISPFAVDISSGVETDGYKDREKIKNAIRSVRYE